MGEADDRGKGMWAPAVEGRSTMHANASHMAASEPADEGDAGMQRLARLKNAKLPTRTNMKMRLKGPVATQDATNAVGETQASARSRPDPLGVTKGGDDPVSAAGGRLSRAEPAAGGLNGSTRKDEWGVTRTKTEAAGGGGAGSDPRHTSHGTGGGDGRDGAVAASGGAAAAIGRMSTSTAGTSHAAGGGGAGGAAAGGSASAATGTTGGVSQTGGAASAGGDASRRGRPHAARKQRSFLHGKHQQRVGTVISRLGPSAGQTTLMDKKRKLYSNTSQQPLWSLRKITINPTDKDDLRRFPSNAVHNHRYSLFSFIFKNLWEQFHRVINWWFLLVAIIQSIPQLHYNPSHVWSTAVPLACVLAFGMAKALVTDYGRRCRDAVLNGRVCYIVDGHQPQLRVLQWKSLRVGNILRLRDGEEVPADIVVLATSNADGVAYAETAKLDGETVLKFKQGVKETRGESSPLSIASIRGRVVCEKPSIVMDSFTGSLKLDAHPRATPLDIVNMIQRGSHIRNTEWLYGVVIYTGSDTRIQKNAAAPVLKRSHIEEDVNSYLLISFFVVFLAILISVMSKWSVQERDSGDGGSGPSSGSGDPQSYSSSVEFMLGSKDALQNPWMSILRFLSVYAPVLPLSLPLVLDAVYLLQSLLIQGDAGMRGQNLQKTCTGRSTNSLSTLAAAGEEGGATGAGTDSGPGEGSVAGDAEKASSELVKGKEKKRFRLKGFRRRKGVEAAQEKATEERGGEDGKKAAAEDAESSGEKRRGNRWWKGTGGFRKSRSVGLSASRRMDTRRGRTVNFLVRHLTSRRKGSTAVSAETEGKKNFPTLRISAQPTIENNNGEHTDAPTTPHEAVASSDPASVFTPAATPAAEAPRGSPSFDAAAAAARSRVVASRSSRTAAGRGSHNVNGCLGPCNAASKIMSESASDGAELVCSLGRTDSIIPSCSGTNSIGRKYCDSEANVADALGDSPLFLRDGSQYFLLKTASCGRRGEERLFTVEGGHLQERPSRYTRSRQQQEKLGARGSTDSSLESYLEPAIDAFTIARDNVIAASVRSPRHAEVSYAGINRRRWRHRMCQHPGILCRSASLHGAPQTDGTADAEGNAEDPNGTDAATALEKRAAEAVNGTDVAEALEKRAAEEASSIDAATALETRVTSDGMGTTDSNGEAGGPAPSSEKTTVLLLQGSNIGKMRCMEDSGDDELWPEVHNPSLIPNLGQVDFVFADKTGTITENDMTFSMCCVAGRVYGFNPDDPRACSAMHEEYAETKDLDASSELSDDGKAHLEKDYDDEEEVGATATGFDGGRHGSAYPDEGMRRRRRAHNAEKTHNRDETRHGSVSCSAYRKRSYRRVLHMGAASDEDDADIVAWGSFDYDRPYHATGGQPLSKAHPVKMFEVEAAAPTPDNLNTQTSSVRAANKQQSREEAAAAAPSKDHEASPTSRMTEHFDTPLHAALPLFLFGKKQIDEESSPRRPGRGLVSAQRQEATDAHVGDGGDGSVESSSLQSNAADTAGERSSYSADPGMFGSRRRRRRSAESGTFSSSSALPPHRSVHGTTSGESPSPARRRREGLRAAFARRAHARSPDATSGSLPRASRAVSTLWYSSSHDSRGTSFHQDLSSSSEEGISPRAKGVYPALRALVPRALQRRHSHHKNIHAETTSAGNANRRENHKESLMRRSRGGDIKDDGKYYNRDRVDNTGLGRTPGPFYNIRQDVQPVGAARPTAALAEGSFETDGRDSQATGSSRSQSSRSRRTSTSQMRSVGSQRHRLGGSGSTSTLRTSRYASGRKRNSSDASRLYCIRSFSEIESSGRRGRRSSWKNGRGRRRRGPSVSARLDDSALRQQFTFSTPVVPRSSSSLSVAQDLLRASSTGGVRRGLRSGRKLSAARNAGTGEPSWSFSSHLTPLTVPVSATMLFTGCAVAPTPTSSPQPIQEEMQDGGGAAEAEMDERFEQRAAPGRGATAAEAEPPEGPTAANISAEAGSDTDASADAGAEGAVNVSAAAAPTEEILYGQPPSPFLFDSVELPTGFRDCTLEGQAQKNCDFDDSSIFDDLGKRDWRSHRLHEFIKCMALCNTVVPWIYSPYTTDTSPGSIQSQGLTQFSYLQSPQFCSVLESEHLRGAADDAGAFLRAAERATREYGRRAASRALVSLSRPAERRRSSRGTRGSATMRRDRRRSRESSNGSKSSRSSRMATTGIYVRSPSSGSQKAGATDFVGDAAEAAVSRTSEQEQGEEHERKTLAPRKGKEGAYGGKSLSRAVSFKEEPEEYSFLKEGEEENASLSLKGMLSPLESSIPSSGHVVGSLQDSGAVGTVDGLREHDKSKRWRSLRGGLRASRPGRSRMEGKVSSRGLLAFSSRKSGTVRRRDGDTGGLPEYIRVQEGDLEGGPPIDAGDGEHFDAAAHSGIRASKDSRGTVVALGSSQGASGSRRFRRWRVGSRRHGHSGSKSSGHQPPQQNDFVSSRPRRTLCIRRSRKHSDNRSDQQYSLAGAPGSGNVRKRNYVSSGGSDSAVEGDQESVGTSAFSNESAQTKRAVHAGVSRELADRLLRRISGTDGSFKDKPFLGGTDGSVSSPVGRQHRLLREALLLDRGGFAAFPPGSPAAAHHLLLQQHLQMPTHAPQTLPSPVFGQYVNIIRYQASSPDEECLVSAAAHMGYTLTGRTSTLVTLDINGQERRWHVIGVNEFSHKRGRMSIVVRPQEWSEGAMLYVKGAVVAMLNLLTSPWSRNPPSPPDTEMQVSLGAQSPTVYATAAGAGGIGSILRGGGTNGMSPPSKRSWPQRPHFSSAPRSFVDRQRQLSSHSGAATPRQGVAAANTQVDANSADMRQIVSEDPEHTHPLWPFKGDMNTSSCGPADVEEWSDLEDSCSVTVSDSSEDGEAFADGYRQRRRQITDTTTPATARETPRPATGEKQRNGIARQEERAAIRPLQHTDSAVHTREPPSPCLHPLFDSAPQCSFQARGFNSVIGASGKGSGEEERRCEFPRERSLLGKDTLQNNYVSRRFQQWPRVQAHASAAARAVGNADAMEGPPWRGPLGGERSSVSFHSHTPRKWKEAPSSHCHILSVHMETGLCGCRPEELAEFLRGTDLLLVEQQSKQFSLQGLRTMALACRYLTQEETETYKRLYTDACASVYCRAERLEEVAEDLERDLEYLGITGVRDKLQAEVPETLELLMEAGIRIWMVTGDNVEYALHICHSCRLLTSRTRIFHASLEFSGKKAKREGVMLYDLFRKARRSKQNDEHICLVVTGTHLRTFLSHPDLQTYFLNMACCSDVVVAARVTPTQKAEMVRLIKKRLTPEPITLAVGDGGNDVPMLQEAHVGVAIRGRESATALAVAYADYSLADFRFLQRLLFVHGRLSLMRISLIILWSLFKSLCIVLPTFYFQPHAFWSAVEVYDPLLLMLFDFFFTCLPGIVHGFTDQDIPADLLPSIPVLYTLGRRRLYFNGFRFIFWTVEGIVYSIVINYLLQAAWVDGHTFAEGQVLGFHSYGILLLFGSLLQSNLRILLETHLWTPTFLIVTIGICTLLFFPAVLLCSLTGWPRRYMELAGRVVFQWPMFYVLVPLWVSVGGAVKQYLALKQFEIQSIRAATRVPFSEARPRLLPVAVVCASVMVPPGTHVYSAGLAWGVYGCSPEDCLLKCLAAYCTGGHDEYGVFCGMGSLCSLLKRIFWFLGGCICFSPTSGATLSPTEPTAASPELCRDLRQRFNPRRHKAVADRLPAPRRFRINENFISYGGTDDRPRDEGRDLLGLRQPVGGLAGATTARGKTGFVDGGTVVSSVSYANGTISHDLADIETENSLSSNGSEQEKAEEDTRVVKVSHLINRFTLRFKDMQLEADYQIHNKKSFLKRLVPWYRVIFVFIGLYRMLSFLTEYFIDQQWNPQGTKMAGWMCVPTVVVDLGFAALVVCTFYDFIFLDRFSLILNSIVFLMVAENVIFYAVSHVDGTLTSILFPVFTFVILRISFLQAVVWNVVFLLAFVIRFTLDHKHLPVLNFAHYLPLFVGVDVFVGFVGYRLEYNQRKSFLLDYAVDASRRKQREILNTMLPAFVVDQMINSELNEDGIPSSLKAEDRGTVSVIFCDVYEFQQVVASIEPTRLVEVLDSLFLCFDRSAEQFGCTKVETVFETYLAAAGLQPGKEQSAASYQQDACDALDMALAMLEVAAQIRYEVKTSTAWGLPSIGPSAPPRGLLGRSSLMEAAAVRSGSRDFGRQRTSGNIVRTVLQSKPQRIRVKIGIHSGRVISGVVGAKKPQYALFGDTVNTASRMKTTGMPDYIHISEESYKLVRDDDTLEYEPRQTEVKGKGIMNTYLLTKVKGSPYPHFDEQDSTDSSERMSDGEAPSPTQLSTTGTLADVTAITQIGSSDTIKKSETSTKTTDEKEAVPAVEGSSDAGAGAPRPTEDVKETPVVEEGEANAGLTPAREDIEAQEAAERVAVAAAADAEAATAHMRERQQQQIHERPPPYTVSEATNSSRSSSCCSDGSSSSEEMKRQRYSSAFGSKRGRAPSVPASGAMLIPGGTKAESGDRKNVKEHIFYRLNMTNASYPSQRVAGRSRSSSFICSYNSSNASSLVVIGSPIDRRRRSFAVENSSLSCDIPHRPVYQTIADGSGDLTTSAGEDSHRSSDRRSSSRLSRGRGRRSRLISKRGNGGSTGSCRRIDRILQGSEVRFSSSSSSRISSSNSSDSSTRHHSLIHRYHHHKKERKGSEVLHHQNVQEKLSKQSLQAASLQEYPVTFRGYHTEWAGGSTPHVLPLRQACSQKLDLAHGSGEQADTATKDNTERAASRNISATAAATENLAARGSSFTSLQKARTDVDDVSPAAKGKPAGSYAETGTHNIWRGKVPSLLLSSRERINRRRRRIANVLQSLKSEFGLLKSTPVEETKELSACSRAVVNCPDDNGETEGEHDQTATKEKSFFRCAPHHTTVPVSTGPVAEATDQSELAHTAANVDTRSIARERATSFSSLHAQCPTPVNNPLDSETKKFDNLFLDRFEAHEGMHKRTPPQQLGIDHVQRRQTSQGSEEEHQQHTEVRCRVSGRPQCRYVHLTDAAGMHTTCYDVVTEDVETTRNKHRNEDSSTRAAPPDEVEGNPFMNNRRPAAAPQEAEKNIHTSENVRKREAARLFLSGYDESPHEHEEEGPRDGGRNGRFTHVAMHTRSLSRQRREPRRETRSAVPSPMNLHSTSQILFSTALGDPRGYSLGDGSGTFLFFEEGRRRSVQLDQPLSISYDPHEFWLELARDTAEPLTRDLAAHRQSLPSHAALDPAAASSVISHSPVLPPLSPAAAAALYCAAASPSADKVKPLPPVGSEAKTPESASTLRSIKTFFSPFTWFGTRKSDDKGTTSSDGGLGWRGARGRRTVAVQQQRRGRESAASPYSAGTETRDPAVDDEDLEQSRITRLSVSSEWLVLKFKDKNLEARYRTHFYNNKSNINTIEQALIIFLVTFCVQTLTRLALPRIYVSPAQTSVKLFVCSDLYWAVRATYTLSAFCLWLLFHYRNRKEVATCLELRWMVFLLNLLFISASCVFALSNSWGVCTPFSSTEEKLVEAAGNRVVQASDSKGILNVAGSPGVPVIHMHVLRPKGRASTLLGPHTGGGARSSSLGGAATNKNATGMPVNPANTPEGRITAYIASTTRTYTYWLLSDTIELFFYIVILHHNTGLLFQNCILVDLLLLTMSLTFIITTAKETAITVGTIAAFPCYVFFNLVSAYCKEYIDRLTFYVNEHAKTTESRATQLLKDMLPKQVLEEFQQDKLKLAYLHESVTFLFADICGFTSWAKNVDACEVVTMLQKLFAKFDKDSTKFGLYKLCTIGDAYVAVSEPVTRENADFALRVLLQQEADPREGMWLVLEMAKSMIANIAEVRERLCIPSLDMRIGLHYGSCVGGVIGSGRLRYDLWGMDVLTGNMMESNGVPGKINVSDQLRAEIEKAFPGEFTFRFNKRVWVINSNVDSYLIRPSKEAAAEELEFSSVGGGLSAESSHVLGQQPVGPAGALRGDVSGSVYREDEAPILQLRAMCMALTVQCIEVIYAGRSNYRRRLTFFGGARLPGRRYSLRNASEQRSEAGADRQPQSPSKHPSMDELRSTLSSRGSTKGACVPFPSSTEEESASRPPLSQTAAEASPRQASEQPDAKEKVV